MVDLPGAIGTGLTLWASKDLINKVLGPTADYIGKSTQEFTKRRMEAVGRIFKNAHEKLGAKIESSGEVHPKVLKTILNDGSFSTDELAIEYLGGILASSRTEQGRDDRGARIAKLVDSLSTYQLRVHYLLYSTMHSLMAGKKLSFSIDDEAKTEVFFPYSQFVKEMDFSNGELAQRDELLTHALWGLHSESLIGHWLFGDHEPITKQFSLANEAGVLCRPSAQGVELFLWAFGHAEKSKDYFFSTKFDSKIEGIAGVVSGSCLTAKISIS